MDVPEEKGAMVPFLVVEVDISLACRSSGYRCVHRAESGEGDWGRV